MTQSDAPAVELTVEIEARLAALKRKLEKAQRERFVFLLAGRTGVGKSSTINSLMDQNVATVGDDEPTTVKVARFDSEASGVSFTVIDTPGLCDALPEVGNDKKYLREIKTKVESFDCLWFVARLDETRVSGDEMRGIKLLSQAFGSAVWKHAIIIFTFANNISSSEYAAKLDRRTRAVRDEIVKYADRRVVNAIPAVAVDNKSDTTPDGVGWIGNLYTALITRMSARRMLSFFVSTAGRVVTEGGRTGPDRPSSSSRARAAPAERRSSSTIRLSASQSRQVSKQIDGALVSSLVVTGATIGSYFGPAGMAVGGAIGAAIGLVAWLAD